MVRSGLTDCKGNKIAGKGNDHSLFLAMGEPFNQAAKAVQRGQLCIDSIAACNHYHTKLTNPGGHIECYPSICMDGRAVARAMLRIGRLCKFLDKCRTKMNIGVRDKRDYNDCAILLPSSSSMLCCQPKKQC
jgi:hypothetical protein